MGKGRMGVPKSKFARSFYRCADKRRVESRILFKADQPTGAVYLAGYVTELMLKALNLENTPANQQEALLDNLKRIGHSLTGLLELYYQKGGSRPPPDVTRAFTLVGDWTSIRYDPKEVDPVDAERFLEAVDTVYRWVDGRL